GLTFDEPAGRNHEPGSARLRSRRSAVPRDTDHVALRTAVLKERADGIRHEPEILKPSEHTAVVLPTRQPDGLVERTSFRHAGERGDIRPHEAQLRMHLSLRNAT